MKLNLSYWELKEWFSNVDFTVVGSGIVGLNCALQLRKMHPYSKIIVLEKGVLPQGASTKNAGFACFGSLSELVHDLETHTEEEVYNLVKKRWEGLQLLRKTIGDKKIDFQQNKGYELFLSPELYELCLAQKSRINKLVQPLFASEVFTIEDNKFHFQNIHENYITNQFEGQIDTGKMAARLLEKVQSSGIKIINTIQVEKFTEKNDQVAVATNQITFKTKKLFIATNGFANQLLNENVQPARAQVLITKPIKDLHIKGTFHLNKGYYYFRNIDDRVLLGGGRNLDFKGEETTNFGQTTQIQNSLEELLKTTILPNTKVDIDHRWSSIMGVGNQKMAVVKQLSNNVFCGVRLGGMGVAIGSMVGKELAELIN